MIITLKKYFTMKNTAIILAAAVMLASCGGSTDKKAELAKLKAQQTELNDQIKKLEEEIAASDTTGGKLKVRDVKIAEVQPTVFRHYIDVQGFVDADENVDVQPLAAGRTIKVHVNEGDNVKQGQVLAELDADVLKRQLESLDPQIKLATDLFNRQERLWSQKIGSEMDYLSAKTNKEYLEKQAATIRENIDMYVIKAPITGTIDFVGLTVGQLAVANPMSPAFRIVNMSGMKVKSEIAESYASKVKRGNPVSIHFPDLNTTIDSKITFKEQVIDPLTRSFTTEASLEGDKSNYHPNMVAVMKIIDYENSNALSIPLNIIQNSGSESFVYVASIEGNKMVARKRIVTVGQTYDGMAEITAGLNANDKIIVSGQMDVVDGSMIQE